MQKSQTIEQVGKAQLEGIQMALHVHANDTFQVILTSSFWSFITQTFGLNKSRHQSSISIFTVPCIHTECLPSNQQRLRSYPRQQPIAQQPPVSAGITVTSCSSNEVVGVEQGRGPKTVRGRKFPFIIHIRRIIISTVAFGMNY